MTIHVHPAGILVGTFLALAPLGNVVRYLRAMLQERLARAEAARRRAARRRALARLDAATLRDLGLARCEIDSVLAEAEGQAEATRTRVLMALHGPGAWT
jgi:uncharacterized protein YjiS (DUF1127 family)